MSEPALDKSYDLPALADRLRDKLPAVVPEYGAGRERIRDVIAAELGVDVFDADTLITQLTEQGLLSYNDDSRAPGVPGHWELRAPSTPKA